MTTKIYTEKFNARRAARAALGKVATENVDFILKQRTGGWTWEVPASAAPAGWGKHDTSTEQNGLAKFGSRLAKIAGLGGADRAPASARKAKAVKPPRETKIGAVLAKAQTKSGVTVPQIHEMTGWKKIGGFFTAAKRNKLTLTKKREDKVTTWFATSAATRSPHSIAA